MHRGAQQPSSPAAMKHSGIADQVERLVGLFYFSSYRPHFVQGLIFPYHARTLRGCFLKEQLCF